LGPHLTHVAWTEADLCAKCHLDLSSRRLTTIDMERKGKERKGNERKG